MLVASAILAAALVGAQEGEMIPEQLRRIARGQLAEVADITLRFEGNISLVDARRDGIRDPEVHEDHFQGQYQFRSGGEAVLDLQRMGKGVESQSTRGVDASSGSEVETLWVVPDLNEARVWRKPSAPGVLNKPGSIERILKYALLADLDDLEHRNFRDLGWSEAEGRRCRRVQFDAMPFDKGDDASRHVIRLWLDLGHGGHPLRTEFWHGAKLAMRCRVTRLDQPSVTGGARPWLPIEGEVLTYLWSDGYHHEPVVRESYKVLEGSILINQGLTAKNLTLASYASRDAELKGRYEAATARPRVDPAGVRAELDKALEEADRQAPRLDASAGNDGWVDARLASRGSFVAGVVLLIAGGFVAWRNSSRAG